MQRKPHTELTERFRKRGRSKITWKRTINEASKAGKSYTEQKVLTEVDGKFLWTLYAPPQTNKEDDDTCYKLHVVTIHCLEVKIYLSWSCNHLIPLGVIHGSRISAVIVCGFRRKHCNSSDFSPRLARAADFTLVAIFILISQIYFRCKNTTQSLKCITHCNHLFPLSAM